MQLYLQDETFTLHTELYLLYTFATYTTSTCANALVAIQMSQYNR